MLKSLTKREKTWWGNNLSFNSKRNNRIGSRYYPKKAKSSHLKTIKYKICKKIKYFIKIK